MDRELFRRLVQDYARQAGLKQEGLAGQLGVHRTVFSNKLHGTKGAQFTRAEVLHLVALLAAEQAIARYAQAVELLAAYDLPPTSFSAAEWAVVPLSRLAREPADVSGGGTGGAVRHNLPAAPTRLVGRAPVLLQLRTLLTGETARLLTLTGPGGIGKTRLALALARQLLDHFTAGVWFVSLAPITDPALILPALATVLGVTATPERPLPAALHDYVQDRTLLLVLDNLEQLLPHAAQIISDLVAAGPGVSILVTSRTLLQIYGEYEFAVPALTLPDLHPLPDPASLTHYEAIRLFTERAGAVKPGFVLTRANAPVVAAICTQLDGLPLAIELAAARVRLLALHTVLDRLGNRLDLLTGGSRDRAPRQQTMRGTIEWSYNLLPPASQALFQRLAPFVGGATVPAIQAVSQAAPPLTGDALAALDTLRDNSLLQQQEQPDGAARFFMLETIRAYAGERLNGADEAGAVYAAHAAYFLALAEAAAAGLRGPVMGEWLDRLDQEHDNLRAVLTWALDAAPETALRIGHALNRFWTARGHRAEARRWLDRALTAGATAAPALRAQALMGASGYAALESNFDEAGALTVRALDLFRAAADRRGTAEALSRLQKVRIHQGQYAAAAAYAAESRTLAEALGDSRLLADSLSDLAWTMAEQDDYAGAEPLLEQSVTLFQTVGDTARTAAALTMLGEVVRAQDEAARAAGIYGQALALAEEIGHTWLITNLASPQGFVAYRQGDYAQAIQHFRAAIPVFQELGDRLSLATAVLGLAAVVGAQGHHHRAVGLLGAMAAQLTAIRAPLTFADRREYAQLLTMLRSQVTPTSWEAAWTAGHALPLDQAVATALADY